MKIYGKIPIGLEGDKLIVHELIHALDHQNKWYLPSTGFNDPWDENLLKAECLTYGTEALIDIVQQLALAEAAVNNNSPNEAQTAWQSALNQSSRIYEVRAFATSNKFKDLTQTEIQDIETKLQLVLRIPELAKLYRTLAATNGVPYSFPLTYRSGQSQIGKIAPFNP